MPVFVLQDINTVPDGNKQEGQNIWRHTVPTHNFYTAKALKFKISKVLLSRVSIRSVGCLSDELINNNMAGNSEIFKVRHRN